MTRCCYRRLPRHCVIHRTVLYLPTLYAPHAALCCHPIRTFYPVRACKLLTSSRKRLFSPAADANRQDTMSQRFAPLRAVVRALDTAPQRQCARLMSTARTSQQGRRPTASCLPKPQLRQPLEQRRFKYKTVEEAKSRYRSGVGLLFLICRENVTSGPANSPAAVFLEGWNPLRPHRRRSPLLL